MSPSQTLRLEAGLHLLIAEVVREELRAAVAEFARPSEYLTADAAADPAKVALGPIRRWIADRIAQALQDVERHCAAEFPCVSRMTIAALPKLPTLLPRWLWGRRRETR